MKRVVLLLALCLLTFSVSAQKITSTKSNKRTYTYPVQPTIKYVGATVGYYEYKHVPVSYGGYDDIYEEGTTIYNQLLGIQGGYLYSLFGDMNKSFTPYVGGEVLLGYNTDGESITAQLGAAVGVMIGRPSFRLDVRIQPELTYWSDCYIDDEIYVYEFGWIHPDSQTIFRPNLALRVGMWINHFNLYLQYHNVVGGGMAWRF